MTDPRVFVMDEAVMVHPVNLHPAFRAAVRSANEAVEDIALVMDEQPSRKFLIEAMGSPIRTANRNRVRHPGRSKADLIEASFDALMGEC